MPVERLSTNQCHLKRRMVKIECERCGGIFRKDNFTRHFNETHLKILPACNSCGKEMTSSSLSRHKKICPPQTSKKDKLNTIENNHIESAANVVSSSYHKIETCVRIDTYSDGRKVIVSDEIKLNDVSVVIVQKSLVDGKYMKIHSENMH